MGLLTFVGFLLLELGDVAGAAQRAARARALHLPNPRGASLADLSWDMRLLREALDARIEEARSE